MNDYAQRICIFCAPMRDRRTGERSTNCDLCVGRGTDRWCECACRWTELDQGGQVTQQPIEDDEYAEDAATVSSDDLDEMTDSQIPPDQGDAGKARVQ